MGGAREGDARVQIVITLFFMCVVAGGVFLSMYTFLPETESTDWYFVVGIILEAIPWVFWLFMYLYTCLRPRGGSDGGYAVNGARGPGPGPAQLPPATASNGAAMFSGPDEIPSTPLQSPGGDDRRHVHFGSVKVVGKEELYGTQGVPQDLEVGGAHEHSGSNTGSTPASSISNDADMSIGSKESEIPLTMGASDCV